MRVTLQALIGKIHAEGPEFNFEEYDHMLTLQCNIDTLADSRAEKRQSRLSGIAGQQPKFDADRTAYNDALIELHSFFM